MLTKAGGCGQGCKKKCWLFRVELFELEGLIKRRLVERRREERRREERGALWRGEEEAGRPVALTSLDHLFLMHHRNGLVARPLSLLLFHFV